VSGKNQKSATKVGKRGGRFKIKVIIFYQHPHKKEQFRIIN
jgi:hypothetical protein